MLIELRISMLVIIVGLFIFFFSMLRKKKLDLKYCLVWMFALLGIAVFCIFPGLLDSLSGILGIGVPVNTLFLICIAFLTFICISLTVVVSRLSARLRQLTQNLAVLEFDSGGEGEREKAEDGGEKEEDGCKP